MACPFPGMDPNLEGRHWHSFHTTFCVEIVRLLNPLLGERYVALIDQRLVSEPLGDAAYKTLRVVEEPVRLRFVEVREAGSMMLVTVIEVLSPANKSGDDRADYLRKRRTILNSDVNLIEIDLLRSGRRAPMRDPLPSSPYFALVHRAATRPVADVWPIGLREPLPSIPVPLLQPDPDVALDLEAVISGVYVTAPFDRLLDYDRPLIPPLAKDDERWVRETVGACRSNLPAV